MQLSEVATKNSYRKWHLETASEGRVEITHLERAMRRFNIATHNALQRVVGVGMRSQPSITEIHQRGRIGIARIQAFQQSLSHVEGLVLPNPVGNLEILGRVRFSQVGTWS